MKQYLAGLLLVSSILLGSCSNNQIPVVASNSATTSAGGLPTTIEGIAVTNTIGMQAQGVYDSYWVPVQAPLYLIYQLNRSTSTICAYYPTRYYGYYTVYSYQLWQNTATGAREYRPFGQTSGMYCR